ncbi:RNA polymerase sigma-70 factor (ECF subfamily) [Lysobacter ruishenii]|uniref:RNA polymerase sigma-70 factor (ECF subfamily) n=2 Tax=Aerolutibacter ruishenii TaxID=686800 RepID=A0A562LWA1_9GAMM|nr:RNA polymerase sigma-70 factor (ECF subfamily) [Lysobacter ruishenii]
MLDDGARAPWFDDTAVHAVETCLSMTSGSARSAGMLAATAKATDFDRFVLEHRPMLVAFLRRRVSDADAQDLAQETMVRLMRYADQPVEALRPLMYRIGLNVLADRGRRDASRLAHAHVSLEDDALVLPATDPAQDERVAHQQALVAVRAAVLRLPPRCREVYLLNRIEDMSYTEIARHCGISVKAVEKHIGKALSLLRTHLRGTQGGHREWP